MAAAGRVQRPVGRNRHLYVAAHRTCGPREELGLPIRAAIIGCGLIGRKRAEALSDAVVTVCCDINLERARSLANKYGSRATTDWQEAVSSRDVDVVFVATT